MRSLPLLVIKFGTASISKKNGEPDLNTVEQIAHEVSQLAQNYRIVLVSSGAVGAGKHFIQNYEGQISQRKAAAAIGNPILLKMYSDAFAKFEISVAQSLLERGHFANRNQFLQLKETYDELWKNKIIPIANENDVVSNRELKFSDNDELATLIAGGFGAKTLLLATSTGGLLDKNQSIIPMIENFSKEIFDVVDNSKSSLGLGGMASKLTFARLAVRMGVEVVIFGMAQSQAIPSALSGKTGTRFLPEKVKLNSKNKWLAAGSLTVGKIFVDEGAETAIRNRKSLLAVGIKKIQGEFNPGEVVEVISLKNTVIAVGKSKIGHQQFKEKVFDTVVIHADDLVLL